MSINYLIAPATTYCWENTSSKKKLLEKISETIAQSNNQQLSENLIFNTLIKRERLGSTGIGKGIAIPHGRIKGLNKPIAILIKLNNAIDFDAIDHQPVDLIFTLLVPEESNQEHLNILAELARKFSQSNLCDELRNTDNKQTLYDVFTHWSDDKISA